jgi:hypothetical protein
MSAISAPTTASRPLAERRNSEVEIAGEGWGSPP